MERDELLDDIAEALTDWMDDRPVSVASVEKQYPGPVLMLRLSDGTSWVVNLVEA